VEENCYDFYLQACDTFIGCPRPVRFFVKHNETSLTKDQLIALTYALCFNYQGTKKAVRLPSVLMYAKRAASFVGRMAHPGKSGVFKMPSFL